MYKPTTFTYPLLVAFLSCVLWGCTKDEPDFSMNLNTEGNQGIMIPYGYSDVAVTYACSDLFLDIVEPIFAIIKNDGTFDVVTPARDEFQLSEEKISVSMKGVLEDPDESVNQEMASYQYTFNERIEGTDGSFILFAFATLKDDAAENFLEMIYNPGASIFRGFHHLKVTSSCPDGQFSFSSAPMDLNSVSGYMVENSIENFIKALQGISNNVPTLTLEYYEYLDSNKNIFPPISLSVNCADVPTEILDEIFGSGQSSEIIESRGKLDFLQKSGSTDIDIIPLIKKYAGL